MNFIDLGLPSGTKWADANYGSNTPYEYGKLYSFSDAKKLSCKLPTHRQLSELTFYCKVKWISKNGINGCEFVGPNNNSIFLPASGRIEVSGLAMGQGNNGFYWSNENGGVNPSSMAWNMMICEDWQTDGCQDIRRKHSVRPIQ